MRCCSKRLALRRICYGGIVFDTNQLSTVGHSDLDIEEMSEELRLQRIYSGLKRASFMGQLSSTHLHDAMMPTITEEVSNALVQPPVEPSVLNVVARLFRLLGNMSTHFYRDSLYQSLSEIFLEVKDEDVLINVVPSFLWGCSKARYYPSSLMDYYGKFVMDNLQRFKIPDLDKIMYAYTKLYHPLPGLIPSLEKLCLSNTTLLSSQHRLAWTIAWAAMVFQDYPRDLLSLILNKEFIEGQLKAN